MRSRARYCWPGSNYYPVTLHDCTIAAQVLHQARRAPRRHRFRSRGRRGPPSCRGSGMRPVPGSRPRLSRFAASDMGLSFWAYAADFGVLVEKSSLKKNLSSFCCSRTKITPIPICSLFCITDNLQPGVETTVFNGEFEFPIFWPRKSQRFFGGGYNFKTG